MKWNAINGWIACDLVVFVDDLRGSGPTVELTWQVSRVVASRLQYLGIQEASRKRRPPTRSPGAWEGGVFRTTANSVCMTVPQEKWDKARTLIGKLWKVMEEAGLEGEGCDVSNLKVDFKELEITRGFFSSPINDV
jgi:hypothetical protein